MSEKTDNEKSTKVSASIFKKRWRKFKTLKRGYYSFIAIVVLFTLSFILPLFIGRDALIVNYNGNYHFPIFKYYSAESFGQNLQGEANYRMLKQQFKEDVYKRQAEKMNPK